MHHSHRQDCTYHGLCYTSCGALAETITTVMTSVRIAERVLHESHLILMLLLYDTHTELHLRYFLFLFIAQVYFAQNTHTKRLQVEWYRYIRAQNKLVLYLLHTFCFYENNIFITYLIKVLDY